MRLGGREMPRGVEDLLGAAGPTRSISFLTSEAVAQAEPRRRDGEARRCPPRCADRRTAPRQAAADAEAVDHGDGRLADRLESAATAVSPTPVVMRDLLGRCAHLLELGDVGAGDEGLLARARAAPRRGWRDRARSGRGSPGSPPTCRATGRCACPGLLNTIQPIAPSACAIRRARRRNRIGASDHARVLKSRNILALIAELAQHRVGVLAALGGRRRASPTACATGSPPGRPARSRRALGCSTLRAIFEMLHLRIGEHLVHLVDRPAGHAGLVQQLDPFGRAPGRA